MLGHFGGMLSEGRRVAADAVIVLKGVRCACFVHERRWYIQKPVGLCDMARLSNLEKITWIKFR
ncbi:hypothetical protein E2C01_059387 [Portunus trituberculatus]|uniref:Uncharacterized protein n=1 Tax=Portunus trituberculatus TaxID=210409 RepID=A0A5B7H579_PORTR|nr:hypothetical protein [Portunus trituberculatus]